MGIIFTLVSYDNESAVPGPVKSNTGNMSAVIFRNKSNNGVDGGLLLLDDDDDDDDDDDEKVEVQSGPNEL